MPRNSWKIFISKKKSEYLHTDPVPSPAFKNKKVCFDERGFNHLIMKKKHYRSLDQQRRRLGLMKEAVSIISSCGVPAEHRIDGNAHFWSLCRQTKSKLITVVVRRIGNGALHFYSVMDKKVSKSTQAPQGGLS